MDDLSKAFEPGPVALVVDSYKRRDTAVGLTTSVSLIPDVEKLVLVSQLLTSLVLGHACPRVRRMSSWLS